MMNTGSAICSRSMAGFVRALLLEAQQILEQAHEELAHGDPAECRETRLVAIRLEQPLERLLDRPCAERGGPGAPLGGAQQVVELERGWIGAESAQCPTAGVQSGHRAAHAACGKAHR